MAGIRQIDWEKTGRNLQLLRNDNWHLRKVSCRDRNFDAGNCEGDCEHCRYDIDSSIRRNELAHLFLVGENTIYNWEKGITPVPTEALLYYAEISQTPLTDIIVFC